MRNKFSNKKNKRTSIRTGSSKGENASLSSQELMLSRVSKPKKFQSLKSRIKERVVSLEKTRLQKIRNYYLGKSKKEKPKIRSTSSSKKLKNHFDEVYAKVPASFDSRNQFNEYYGTQIEKKIPQKTTKLAKSCSFSREKKHFSYLSQQSLKSSSDQQLKGQKDLLKKDIFSQEIKQKREFLKKETLVSNNSMNEIDDISLIPKRKDTRESSKFLSFLIKANKYFGSVDYTIVSQELKHLKPHDDSKNEDLEMKGNIHIFLKKKVRNRLE